MAFLDKLKNVANIATDKIATLQEEREKNTYIQSLEDFGSVQGDNVPSGSKYFMDNKNNRIIIAVGYDKKYFCEYSYSDVSDFKLFKYSNSDIPGSRLDFYTFQITLNSGEKLNLEKTRYVYEEKDAIKTAIEQEDKSKIRIIILAFALVIKDKKTKKWINEFFEADNLLQIFDENGEFSANNVLENTNIIRSRKF